MSEFELDVDELAEQMGIPALRQEVQALRQALEQMLAYANLLDRRLQTLLGEKVITTQMKSHIGENGDLVITESLPQPDMATVRRPQTRYRNEPPGIKGTGSGR